MPMLFNARSIIPVWIVVFGLDRTIEARCPRRIRPMDLRFVAEPHADGKTLTVSSKGITRAPPAGSA